MDAAHTHLRKVVYKCNFRLSHMTHICISDFQSMPPPFVNLFRGGGPDNIAVKSEKKLSETRETEVERINLKRTYLKHFSWKGASKTKRYCLRCAIEGRRINWGTEECMWKFRRPGKIKLRVSVVCGLEICILCPRHSKCPEIRNI